MLTCRECRLCCNLEERWDRIFQVLSWQRLIKMMMGFYFSKRGQASILGVCRQRMSLNWKNGADIGSCAWCILHSHAARILYLKELWAKSDADELDLTAKSPKRLHEQEPSHSVISSTKHKGFDNLIFRVRKFLQAGPIICKVFGIWADSLFLLSAFVLPSKMRAAFGPSEREQR